MAGRKRYYIMHHIPSGKKSKFETYNELTNEEWRKILEQWNKERTGVWEYIDASEGDK